ncbi:MAG TPA: preprotein translocase subunit SecA [Cyclobacteriaceae bacterium]|nr:preprotein translocase subunit SecA [Cyclobacteriaceae bacterium]HMV08053.1 preprotein translocase subunit SecA [Cyclobacteriaceae bacterium]HMV88269.1 preprotein translocase subunit SecA [Cyclobacteriaceae bacterium]HMX00693.1 preprotein translocase subunit SecA [Cyclobacteriaceae bacterium]HMX49432.1 preprotein translocase subunit SecA [Cyclobacteriaceae bacterium]
MLKLIAKIFGTKSQKDIKQIMPLVEQTRQEGEKLTGLSHDQLRSQTLEVQNIINEELREIDEQLAALHRQIADNPDLNIQEKESVFAQIDKLELERNKELEKVLMKVLPRAFAIIRETAKRFKENEVIEVTANDFDRELSGRHENVTISGDKAIWANQWKAAGNMIKWDMVHYDVQIIGGIVLHQGKISEMATGEGKTLVATFPAFLNALAKRGVHVVTVNNYLALRDSEWMGPIFQFHGLQVDCIDKHEPNSTARRKAYLADITYGTNNEFGFDYLRDNMAKEPADLVQRGHHYAMVDEVDSVLIDEARTPLIISGPVPKGDQHEFADLKPRIYKLVEAQKKIVGQYLVDAKKLITEGDEKEGGTALFRAFRGLPKNKPLIKYLSETGNRAILQKTENFYLQDNKRNMPEADKPLYFIIDEKDNSVELTEKGIDLITGEGEDPKFFIMPEIGTELNKLEKDSSLDDQTKFQKKEEIIRDYQVKSQRIHSVNQLLKAYTLFEKDTEYIIVDGKVKIVDEQTGRVLDGRRYSDGLHQAIEAKENVKVEDATQTYATITLQNYFRMYHKLAGMTGTAETEAGEFWDIYKLDVVTIPTNKPVTRKDYDDYVYKTMREKFNAVADEIVKLTQAGRPVLVGTTSVEISELVSRMLQMRKIKHNVLNAKQHQREAEIVAEAGKPGTVTIATNMAGRGTDIKLTPESRAAGGLAIIGTERHESRRVDRQLRGRSGRQGDPGSSQFYVSLEDNLMRLFMPERIARIMDRLGLKEGEVIQHSMVTSSIERAQKKVEENNFGIRKRLLEYDNVMNSQREVIYKRRKNALYGERLELDILTMMFDLSEEIATSAKNSEDYDSLRLNVLSTLGIDFEISEDGFRKTDAGKLAENLYERALEHYHKKNKLVAEKALPVIRDIYKTRGATVENILVPFSDGTKTIGVGANLKKSVDTNNVELVKSMEKAISLSIIDQLWKEHLREMDDLKQSVQTAVYEQKDPLLIYKFEGFELFKRLIGKVNEETITFLMKADIPVQKADQVEEARVQRNTRYKEQKDESQSLLSGGGGSSSGGQQPGQQTGRPPQEKVMPVKSEKIANRNDKVNVQYTDGRVLKDVKYKKVEDDILNNRCIVID